MGWMRMVLVFGWVLGVSAGLGGCPVETRTEPCSADFQCPEGQGCISETCQSVECRTSLDCEADLICLDYVCVSGDDCQADEQCSSEQVCDAGSCRPGCRSHAQCPSGQCDPVSRSCVDCLQNDDCELGEVCAEGACQPGCTGDRDCPQGLRCFEAEPPHGLCAECLDDGDCPASERCVADRCLSSCIVDADCPVGEVCDGGGCRIGCRDDQDCPGGRCDLGSWSCVECLNVDDCTLGQLCVDFGCTPGCKGDRDCPVGQICMSDEPPHGACVECVNPDDCPDEGPRACVLPLQLDFGSVPPGQTASLSFAIESCGQTDLTLTGLVLDPQSSADFSLPNPPAIPFVVAVGETLVVQVQYDPGQVGTDIGDVDIFSDDVDAQQVTGYTASVLLAGRSDEHYCDLLVTPPAVDFGVILVGDSSQFALTLSNSGNQACVLDQVAIGLNSSMGEFDLSQPVAPGTSIPPGGSLDVTVAYSPGDLGQDTGRLDILCNDKDGDQVAVSLEGFAQPDDDGPVAVCSVSPILAPSLGSLTWTGDQSFDPMGGRTIIEWSWTVVSFPIGSSVGLSELGVSNRNTMTDLAGEYSAQLVVTNDLAQSSQPCTATAEVVPSQDLWIEMYWQQDGDDMDLHLLAPGGVKLSDTDCYYANCVPPFGLLDWGTSGSTDNPHLALDNIPGTGPEIIYIQAPADGLYTVYVHDYPASTYMAANIVTVNVWLSGTKVSTFDKAISGEDTDWDVCQIDLPSGSVTAL